MSLLARRFGAPTETRAVQEWGSSAIPGPLAGTAGQGSFSTVDLRRADDSLQKVAVWSSVDLLASLAAQLPLDTFRRTADGEGKLIPNPKLIDDPGGEGYGAPDWVYQYLTSKLLRGNAVGKPGMVDPSTGRPTQITLYHPDDVMGWRDRDTGAPRWRVGGYEVPAAEVWHSRAYPLAGSLMGMSPVTKHITTISEGIAAARFGLQFFTDGAHPSSLLQNELVDIDQATAAETKARYMAAVFGTREPVVLGRGWNHKQISVSPEESQFLATQKYTGAECCRIFGPCIGEILGYETGGSMTYQNVEQRSIDLLKFALNRWLIALEQDLTRLLPGPQYVKCKRAAILQTDVLTRFRAYNMAIAGHWFAPSEVRPLEDLPALTAEQQAEIEALALPAPVIQPLKESEK